MRSPDDVARRLRELEAELAGNRPGASSRRFVYVAMGASDAVGIGGTGGGYVPLIADRLRQRLPRTTVRNLGISGATLEEIVEVELPEAISARPDLVTIMAGGNDVVQGVDPDDFRASLRYLLERVVRLTRRVVVATVPNIALLPVMDAIPDVVLPFGDKRAYVSARCMSLGRVVIQEASARGAKLVHITTTDVLADASLVAADGFHPSDTGYRRIAERFWEQIEPLLPA